MKKLIDKKRIIVFFWIGLAFLGVSLFGDLAQHPETFGVRALNDFWGTIYATVINYFLFEYTLPKLSWKRFFSSFFRILGYIFLYSWASYLWRLIGMQLYTYTSLIVYTKVSHAVANQMGYNIGTIFFFAIARHIYHYIKLKQTTQQLRIEKQQAELNYLRSQTNPHFLFNTLNNIYSLARDKSDLAPESILRLSKILRYMLYETSGPFVAIDQELKIMADYIALEKLRYDDSLRINFNHDIEDMKQALPPLLLIPLVENAFKHGAAETRNQPFVDIHLSINKRQLMFVVKNSTDEFLAEGRVKENIGLTNLRRQLEFLYTDYNLSVQQSETVFTATLKINLSSHV